jgi:CubicO group peptidase (beta-lactamase class C family)
MSAIDIPRIRDAAQEQVEAHHLPGLAVGVVQRGDLVLAEAFGYADIESERRQDPALRQRIGSITKTMAGLCAMALVDEGRLALSDRVVDRLPDMTFHGPAESMTVRHLLTHTSGIGEVPMPEDIRNLDDTLWSDEPEIPRPPEAYPNGMTVDVEPGTKWAYANHAFVLLGEIVARIEGDRIEDVVQRRVFEPLGMTNTDILDTPHADLTTGYHRAPSEDARELLARIGQEPPAEEPVDGHNIRGDFHKVRGPAAGAVQSNIPDMARYAAALLNKGTGIVRPETFDSMVAPQWCPDERLKHMGLAFLLEPRFGQRTFGHGGGVTGGWNTMLTVVPDEELAVLVHLNLSYEKFAEVDGKVLQAALGAPDHEPAAATVDAALLTSAPGVYEATPGGLTNYRVVVGTGRIQLSERDGELWLHARRGPWKQGIRLDPADADDPALLMLDRPLPEPELVALVRDASGAVTGLRCDRLVEMVRTEQVAAWA